MDLCYSMNEVESLDLALEDLRIEESAFDDMYSRAKTACDWYGIEIPYPKKRKIPRKLDDKPETAHMPKDKKRKLNIFLFYEVLDKMISGIKW